MLPQTRTISRDDLYRRVWETPMRHLAPQLGLSDRALAKKCRAHKIPLPGLSYWAKRRHGRTARRLPLPTVSDLDLQTVTLPEPGPPTTKRRRFHDPRLAELASREALEDHRIVVPAQLRSPHPVTVGTKAALADSRPNQHRRLQIDAQKYPRCFDVQVCPPLVPRALRVIDTLAKAMINRGHAVEFTSSESHPTACFIVAGEKLQVVIFERVTQIRPSEKSVKDRPRWNLSRAWDFKSSGRLEVQFGNWMHPVVKDRPEKRIEDQLNKVIVAMLRKADEARHRRLEREREVHRQAEYRRQAAEFAKRQEDEQAGVDALLAEAEAWRRARVLRRYIEAQRRRMEATGTVDAEWLE